MTDAETRLASFFAKYEAGIAELGRALRAKLRARLPGLFEIVYVYEKQDALVISYSPTEHGYDGLCSFALYPDRAHLHFTQGALLSKSDPDKRLQGRGTTVRHLVLNASGDVDRAEIEVLLVAVLKLANLNLVPGATGSVVFRVDAQRQRASRAAKAARRDSAPLATRSGR